MITNNFQNPQRTRRKRGFTLPELATAVGLSLAIAAIMMTRIIKAQSFLVDEAPQVNNTIAQIIARADAYRIHNNLSDAIADANAVTENGKVLVLGYLNPDGSRDFGIISFETNSGQAQLGYYVVDPTVPFTNAGNPDWLISRRVQDADFFVESGVFRMELTGPAGESITYSGTPRL